jgi:2,3-bisphosphoglycerate-independent phosphoglycerate mutase
VTLLKYIVILGDGMADYPVESLGGKTPLEVAKKPYMDMIAQKGEIGLVQTVPKDFPPGSDVANLSAMGYDPYKYYTGRSPLEGVSMGVNLGDNDTAFLANLVTLSDEEPYSNKTMIDYSSDEISTREARAIMQDINKQLGNEFLTFYGGISYRHLMVWKGCDTEYKLTPPHDISGKPIAKYLPDSPIILHLMEKSNTILKNHPINLKRVEKGLRPANSIWIWGQGKKPSLSSFQDKYGIKGCVISAVDLVKGIGICAGMKSVEVEGATGNIHTNFEGKANAAISCLEESDFVYVHIEAPDECGHRFETENKVRAIELIDEKVIKPIFDTLTEKKQEFSIMVLPDHPTPLSLGTHVHDPVPYAIYRFGDSGSNLTYTEANGKKGKFIEKGYKLMDYFIKG